MSPRSDGWNGVMTGPMRGRPLKLCAKAHSPIAFTERECPICEAHERIRVLIVSIQAEQTKRCAECKQKGTH